MPPFSLELSSSGISGGVWLLWPSLLSEGAPEGASPLGISGGVPPFSSELPPSGFSGGVWVFWLSLPSEGAPEGISGGVPLFSSELPLSGISGGVWVSSLSSPSWRVTELPSMAVIWPVMVCSVTWSEFVSDVLPQAVSDSASAAAQRMEQVFLPFIKMTSFVIECCLILIHGAGALSVPPVNAVIIARQPKGDLKKRRKIAPAAKNLKFDIDIKPNFNVILLLIGSFPGATDLAGPSRPQPESIEPRRKQ